MSLEEFEDKMDSKTRRYLGMRSLMDFGMGIIYIGVGIFIFFAKKFHMVNDFTEGVVGKVFACIAILYGVWRIYRGIKKDYLREQ